LSENKVSSLCAPTSYNSTEREHFDTSPALP